MVRRISHLLPVVLCVCVLFVTGCPPRDKAPDGIEDLDAQKPLPGDIPLADRVPGIPVTDPESRFPAVLFDYDSFMVRDDATPTIESVAAYMKRNGDVNLVVEGHCDERGSREYNLSLGEHRALAVRAHLVRLGVRSDRIQTRSYGEENPVDFGHSEGAWRRNRRGEFVFYR